MESTLYVLYLFTANDVNMLVLQGDTRVADIFLTEFMRLFNQCIKPRPVCAQGHGRKCESGSRRRFEPASAGSNVDCHDIHAIAAEPDGFRSQFTFPGVGPQDGSHAIAVEIDFPPQVVMAIRLNEALRASVTSTDASLGEEVLNRPR
jgi:hypothetical protein